MASSEDNNNNTTTTAAVWKHIGLHGYAVGTFSCEASGIIWKSAVTGRDDASTTRKIPASKLDKSSGAQWTVFGRSGLIRVPTTTAAGSSSSSSSNLKHEYRFDGFPVADFDVLKATFQKLYQLDLKVLTVSAAGAQYGVPEIRNNQKLLTLKHCVLQDNDDLQEEGQELEGGGVTVGDEMLSLDLTEVSQCVLPGNNRNELEIQFPETDTMEAGTDQLGEWCCCCCVLSFVLLLESLLPYLYPFTHIVICLFNKYIFFY